MAQNFKTKTADDTLIYAANSTNQMLRQRKLQEEIELDQFKDKKIIINAQNKKIITVFMFYSLNTPEIKVSSDEINHISTDQSQNN